MGTVLQGKTQTIDPFFWVGGGGQVTREKVCPMAAILNCIEAKCAWYVEEKKSCAVKLIAIDEGRNSR